MMPLVFWVGQLTVCASIYARCLKCFKGKNCDVTISHDVTFPVVVKYAVLKLASFSV